MHCPLCHNILQQLEVVTNHGKKFSVDHCGRCGGTWFDPYEIHRIPFHEVVRLAHITVLPKTPRIFQDNLFCPVCHKALEPLQVNGKPVGTQLMKCHRCGGIWATQKELEKMADFSAKGQKTQEKLQSDNLYQSLSVLFLPALLTFILLYGTFVTISSMQQSKDIRVSAISLISEITIRTLDSSAIHITFATSKPLFSSISFGTSLWEMETLPIAQTPSTAHSQIIYGLKPNTTYIYRLELKDEQENRENIDPFRFTTGN